MHASSDEDPKPEEPAPEEAAEAISPEIEVKVAAVADRFLDELHSGRSPSRREIVFAHPELAPWLEHRLAVLEMLNATGSGRERVRCPHCGHRAPISGADGGAHALCSSCGSSFRVDPGLQGGGDGLPDRIGRFEIVERVGRGAFGVVYKATDPELRRTVAIKVPRSGVLGTGEEEERFLNEARSAGRLRHPAIVQVHEVGRHHGVPYFVSDFIDGETLADVIGGERPSFRSSAELIAEIAEALDHAHAEGIVHRDVKPHNILLGAAGRPHLTDFGLARHDEESVTVTLDGQILGTPAYMSPEQAAGNRAAVGPCSDIYSVGVVFYEMLTGERPFRGSRSMLLHQLLHDEPRPPRSLNDHIPRDLETICLKAMAKEPQRRYASAHELAKDVRRFLSGEPIHARPFGRVERLWRWCRRKPAVAGLSGAVALLLLAAAMGSTAGLVQFRLAWEVTEKARSEATAALADSRSRVVRFTVDAGNRQLDDWNLVHALPWFAEALRLDGVDPAHERIHRVRLGSALRRSVPLVLAGFHRESIHDVRLSPDGGRFVTASQDGSAIVWDTESGKPVAGPLAHGGPVVTAAFSPDGARIVTASQDGTARIWDAASGRPLSAPLRHEGRVFGALFAPDGRSILTWCEDGTASIWDAPAGDAARGDGAPGDPLKPLEKRTGAMRHAAAILMAAFSPDGGRVATASSDGTARIWNAANGEPAIPPLSHGEPARPVRGVAFAPGGAIIATAGDDGTARIWSATTGEPNGPPMKHVSSVSCLAFSPDGAWIITGGVDSLAVVWDAATGVRISGPMRNGSTVQHATFSPDGRLAVTCGNDFTAHVWDARTGRKVAPLLLHSGVVVRAAFHPDGRRLLTAATDGAVRLWDLASGEAETPKVVHQKFVRCASFHPDGRRVLVSSIDGISRIWDTSTGEASIAPVRQGTSHVSAVFSEDGKLFATGSANRVARVWDSDNGRPVSGALRHDGLVCRLAFSPDGKLLATTSHRGTVRVWDHAAGKEVSVFRGHARSAHEVAFSPDGQLVLSTSSDGTARMSRSSSGEPFGPPLGHQGMVSTALFSRDGLTVLTSGIDGTAQVWETASAKPIGERMKHFSSVPRAAFSPDGTRVATASLDGTARVWDARTGLPFTPRIQHGSAEAIAFSPDGGLVATGTSYGATRAWDSRTGEAVTPDLRHGGAITVVTFSPDGRKLLSASKDGTVRILDLTPEEGPLDRLRLVAAVLAARKIDATGSLVPMDPAEFEARWKELQERFPGATAPTRARIRAWHKRQAEDAERSGDWKAALFHFVRSLENAPGIEELKRMRERMEKGGEMKAEPPPEPAPADPQDVPDE